MIEFIPEKDNNDPQFHQVKENQFFIDSNKYLCQKRSSTAYNIIASEEGEPFCLIFENVLPERKIHRILATIERITF